MTHISLEVNTANCCWFWTEVLFIWALTGHGLEQLHSSSRPRCSWKNMHLSVVFHCDVLRFCMVFVELTMDKGIFHSSVISHNLALHLSKGIFPCLHQEELKNLSGPTWIKGWTVVVHVVVSIGKNYSRAMLRIQLPNCVVSSSQMVLKAS